MKRILLVLLAVLLLAGCGADQPEDTSAPGTTAWVVPGLYEPDSAMETATDGAVRAYPLVVPKCRGLELMGGEVLLFYADGSETVLSLLSGEKLNEKIRVSLNSDVFPAEPDVRVNDRGVGYYDSDANEVVFLDAKLQETGRMKVPDAVQGTPVLTRDHGTIYYCTDNAVRALDLQTGNPRLVRGEYTCQWQTLNQLYWNDTILKCAVGVSDTETNIFFFSAENGEMLFSGDGLLTLNAAGDWYYACVQDGQWQEHIFGKTEQNAQTLQLPEHARVFPALELGGVITEVQDDTGTNIDLYDLEAGKRSAAVRLEGVTKITDYAVDVEANCIWFLDYNINQDSQTLYRWDYLSCSVMDNADYTEPYYTAENPDVEGLTACQTRAEALGQTYGVEITLWNEAEALEPGHYDYEPEYRVKSISKGLDDLERALAAYPEGFLQQTASRTDSGVIHISLLRDITGDPHKGTLTEVSGIQYWSDQGDAYIGLVLGDTLEQTLYHEMFHVVDSYVLSSCVLYDDWENLNPRDFEYDFDYIQNQSREDHQYLEEGSRSFVDMYSMSYPGEDRAGIMGFAMMDGSEAVFSSDTMQKKLTRLCEGIREAYDLEDVAEILPWEVYLEKQLAPEIEE